MADEVLNDPVARAVNWAKDQMEQRRAYEEREAAWHKAHPMAHTWKKPLRTDIPPNVHQMGDLYLVFDPKKKRQ